MVKLGQRLRDQRVQKGLSVDDVTRATHIRPGFISAIEKSEYHKLPASAYARGFVLNYAEYLGLSRRETLALFRREFDEAKAITVLPERFANPTQNALSHMKIHQTVVIMALIILTFLGYLGFSYRDAFMSPPLTITSPLKTQVSNGEVNVSGKTNPYATVTVNNSPVSLNEDGSFSKTISTFPGKNIITIKSVNRFGKSMTIQKIVEVKE